VQKLRAKQSQERLRNPKVTGYLAIHDVY